jgi:hypothetical protein
MQEFDLNSIWSEADKKAESWYEELRPELERMARQKNDSVLQRIKRLVEIEMAVSVMIIIGFIVFNRSLHPVVLATIIVSLVGVLFISYRYYRHFRQQIELVPTMNIKASTAAYLEQLSNYKRRLIRLSLIFLPFGLVIGFVAGFAMGADNDLSTLSNPLFWLSTLPILFVAAVLSYGMVRAYYRFFIGTQEDELREVLVRLNGEDE